MIETRGHRGTLTQVSETTDILEQYGIANSSVDSRKSFVLLF